MLEEESQIVTLDDVFYRDSIGKMTFIMTSLGVAILLLATLSIYLYAKKPKPIVFPVYQDWRVQPLVSVDQPYLSLPAVTQWASDTMQKAFVYDFKNYNAQQKAASLYFTDAGWKTFLNQLNIYVNYNNVLANKLFVNGTITAAPTVLNQGVLSGRYTWIIQMPMNINYAGFKPLPRKPLVLEVHVVRVPTIDNLVGVAIDSVMLATTGTGTVTGTGSG